MAENGSKLTKEQFEQFQKWLEKKSHGELFCPICGVKKWIVGEHIVAPPVQTPGGGMIIGGASYPLASIICSNCGFTRFFNALIAGVRKPDKEEEGKKEEKEKKHG